MFILTELQTDGEARIPELEYTVQQAASISYNELTPHFRRISKKFRRTGTVSMSELYWWEIQKERDHWEDQDVGGWTILKLILER
jgi:hypothetical protein